MHVDKLLPVRNTNESNWFTERVNATDPPNQPEVTQFPEVTQPATLPAVSEMASQSDPSMPPQFEATNPLSISMTDPASVSLTEPKIKKMPSNSLKSSDSIEITTASPSVGRNKTMPLKSDENKARFNQSDTLEKLQDRSVTKTGGKQVMEVKGRGRYRVGRIDKTLPVSRAEPTVVRNPTHRYPLRHKEKCFFLRSTRNLRANTWKDAVKKLSRNRKVAGSASGVTREY